MVVHKKVGFIADFFYFKYYFYSPKIKRDDGKTLDG